MEGWVASLGSSRILCLLFVFISCNQSLGLQARKYTGLTKDNGRRSYKINKIKISLKMLKVRFINNQFLRVKRVEIWRKRRNLRILVQLPRRQLACQERMLNSATIAEPNLVAYPLPKTLEMPSTHTRLVLHESIKAPRDNEKVWQWTDCKTICHKVP